MTADVHIRGVGVFGPGLPDWPRAREVLAGRAAYEHAVQSPPSPELLPATERRRATVSTRVALAVARQATAEAGIDLRALPTVFCTSSGNPDILHDLCEMLAAGDTQISPTKFHNSVHNAAAGYYSIALASQSGSTSICAYDITAAAGLMEAVAQVADTDAPLLLVSYDIPYPYPLSERRPMTDAWGVALLLAPASHVGAAGLSLSLTDGEETRMTDAALEHAREHNPTARLLPLLALLAQGATGAVRLPFNRGTLEVRIDAAAQSADPLRAVA